MNLVVDASVALKWFFRDRDDEADVESALRILTGVDTGLYRLWQPPHFLAEMAAVLARSKPGAAAQDLSDLQSIHWDTVSGPAVYATAIALAVEFNHHLFDTLYHAAALHVDDALLVTADQRYFQKARGRGRITTLSKLARSP